MSDKVRIELLAAHPEAVPRLREWFEAEWPTYYGEDGPGDALHDLRTYANAGSLPVGVVALRNGEVCGVGALKSASIASHAHLTPWAAAGLVAPELRGRGIGRLLLAGVEQQARHLGYPRIYCGTSSAENLLQRCGWQLLERILHDGQPLAIYSKEL